MKAGERFNRHVAADLGVLIVLAVMAAAYCYDAVSASTHIYNLVLVLPLTVIVLVLCCAQFVIALRSGSVAATDGELAAAGPVMLLFTAYVVSLNWLGFDVGTALFIGAYLRLHGERRWPWLIAYALAFAFVLTIFFARMLPYPMPLLLPFGGGGGA